VKLSFQKYQGTGNDFVIVKSDDLNGSLSTSDIQQICARKWGVGSDGLMVISPSQAADYRLDFYNPDGSQSFCGNGARCSVDFVHRFITKKEQYNFEAIDGIHEGFWSESSISISMLNVHSAQEILDGFFCHTGSPHFMKKVDHLDDMDIVRAGSAIRYDEHFLPGGTNVNFLQEKDGIWHVRTYERGVEDETLSCGTGVTAAGLFLLREKPFGQYELPIQTRGGLLSIIAEKTGDFKFNRVYLKGAVKHVFGGLWEN
jgi:diaminopimelate epimerase